MAAKKYIKNNGGQLTEQAATVVSAGVANDGDIIALDSTGRLDPSVLPIGVGQEVLSITAFENLSAGDFVNIFLDGGVAKVRKADASGGNAKKADGFVIAAFTTGNTASVYFGNVNTGVSGLTIGAVYYLSDSVAGGITSTAPTASAAIVQQLGKAVTATSLLVEVGQTITLA
jgi:hypothetical protein